MSVDKGIFTLVGEMASKLSQIFSVPVLSQEEKNNAIICAIVEKMMQNRKLDASDFNNIVSRLEPIYQSEHRHSYSDISSVIYKEKEKTDAECQKKAIDNDLLDVLAHNNDGLHEYVINYYDEKDKKTKEDEQTLVRFQKLYDHIKLEIVRLNNYDDQIKRAIRSVQESNAKTEERLKAFDDKMDKKSQEIEEKINEEVKKVRDESNKLRSEYISILGIFSAVVLAFVGGMAFSTSVLENVNKASAYRLILIALIIGIVFFNIIWVLLDFIRSMDERKYIWITVNALLVSAIFLSCLAYKFDWFAREEQITQHKNQQIEQELLMENTNESKESIDSMESIESIENSILEQNN